jgi:SynChlorMet cassette radical SAM/SPASM protein ScmF
MSLCDVPDVPDNPATTGQQALPDLPEGIPPLRSFYLYLSSSCNLRCRHCWITPEYAGGKLLPGQCIDLAALRDAVTEGKTLGLCSAKLTGGEPMLHPQFKEIVELLTAEGLTLNMETNGTLMTREMAHFLKEKSNVGCISVSLDSPVAAEHDAFRGVKGAFEDTLRGLDHMVGAGYTNCQVIMAVHHGNRHQVEDLVRLATEHKAGSVKFNVVNAAGRGKGMKERGETLTFQEHLDFARYVNEELRPKASIDIIQPMPTALTPLSELWRTRGRCNDCGVIGILGILGGGEIALCGIGKTTPELVYGHLGKDSIREIWFNHPLILALRKDIQDVEGYPGICGSCIHARSCRTGCVAHNFLNNGRLVSPQRLCNEAANLNKFPESRRKDIHRSI